MRLRQLPIWFVVLISLGGCDSHPTFSPAKTVSGSEPQANVFAIGDWGDDTIAQHAVAAAMAEYAGKPAAHQLDGVLLTGDNFYMDLTGPEDTRWRSVFERVYDRHRLNVPFYAILGNHDYQGVNAEAELAYSRIHPDSRWKMPARWYRLEMPANDPLVTVLMLDSNFVELAGEKWQAQLAWLEAELAKPRTTPWVMVVAHHPLYSDGRAKDNPWLIKDWQPLLQKYNVDFYLSGHDHNLQHLEIPGMFTTFLISGGGGGNTHHVTPTSRAIYANEDYGFMHLRFGEKSADVSIVGTDGAVVHTFSRPATQTSALQIAGSSDQ